MFDQPPTFDQQAFAEAIGITTAVIAQASAAGSQGGPSNLHRFRAHHPLTFTGGGDPMVANYWFMQVEKVLEAMEIVSDTTKIKLAAFQLEGEAQVWWNWAKTSRDLEAMTWVEFHDLFMGKYFPDTTRHAKAQEFLELKQGTMTVIECDALKPGCPLTTRQPAEYSWMPGNLHDIHENRAESPLYEELYPNTKPVPNNSQ